MTLFFTNYTQFKFGKYVCGLRIIFAWTKPDLVHRLSTARKSLVV
nr:MAG TPA: hypothetical protein [Caudoviricetes sp.]